MIGFNGLRKQLSVTFLNVLCIALVSTTHTAMAEVATDGSLGAQQQLSGPGYVINEALGSLAGNNLFHSFSTFNLNQNESATFTGAESIQNIISRVTGGETSHIDGIIASSINSANLFFLNPAGVVFGEHASIDLSGSFHVSSADFMEFADGERFYTQPLDSQVLSTSAPVSFGFLTPIPEDVELAGTHFFVEDAQTIQIVAGDIYLNNDSDLFAPSGNIAMTAIGGKGETALVAVVNPLTDSLAGSVAASNEKLSVNGTISVQDASIIEISNVNSELGAGSILIQGGQFILDNNSHIYASSDSAVDGQIISIKVDNLTISEQSSIFSLTDGEGRGTEINLQVSNQLLMTEGGEIPDLGSTDTVSGLISRTQGSGQAGDIIIQAGEIRLSNKASIDMSTFGSGDAGIIEIIADGAIRLVGDTHIYADSQDSGQGGIIFIQAESLSIAERSNIDVGAFRAGDGGSIQIHLVGTLALTDHSRIYSDTSLSGQGGVTIISAADLKLEQHSSIDSSSNASFYDTQQKMDIYAQDGSGDAGDIQIQVSGSVVLSDQSSIKTASFWDAEKNAGEAGDAGSINIVAGNNIELSGGSSVNSESSHAGGGILTLNSGNRVYLLDSLISSSVENGAGNGGDIYISSGNDVILNQSGIIAQAFRGSGGNIHIKTQNFVAGQNSIVDASSELGIDGSIDIEAPAIETDSSVQVLSTQYLDTRQWQQQPCATRSGNGMSRFVVAQKKGVATQPEDMMVAEIDDFMESTPAEQYAGYQRLTLNTVENIPKTTQVSCFNAL